MVLGAMVMTLLLAGVDVTGVAVPPALAPWVPFLLDDAPDSDCPRDSAAAAPQCLWPGVLTLRTSASGAAMSVTVINKSALAKALTLPGAAARWPSTLTVDGKAALIVDNGGAPTVFVSPGEHAIAGRIDWSIMPEALAVPALYAVLALYRDGTLVRAPQRDVSSVFFDTAAQPVTQESSLEVSVVRKLTDGVPLLMETRVLLTVAGDRREVVIPDVVLDGFTAMSVTGTLPARLDGNRVRIQAAAGSHLVVVTSHRRALVSALVLPAAADSHSGVVDEAWVFAADTQLRTAHLEGVSAVAAEQTRLPTEWRALPAYRVLGGDTVKLVTDKRGAGDVIPQVTLKRDVWIDYDGVGATVRDTLTGRLGHDRIEVLPGTQLGRAVVDGTDAFLSRLSATGPVGVELRTKDVSLVADSRLAVAREFTAVPFDLDVQSANININLPPGYALLYARGVDAASGSIAERFSLFEWFVTLLLVIAVARVWGLAWGAVTLLALLLSMREVALFRPLLIGALVLAAVTPALSTTRVAKLVRVVRFVIAIAMVAVVVFVTIRDVRGALYPVLSNHEAAAFLSDAGLLEVASTSARGYASNSAPAQTKMSNQKTRFKYDEQNLTDTKSVVQTGPGVPTWRWGTSTLSFSGPVERSQTVQLTLVTPNARRLIVLLRSVLMMLLVAAAFAVPASVARLRASFAGRRFAKIALWCALALVTRAGAARAQPENAAVNDNDVAVAPPIAVSLSPALEVLKARLLAPPVCAATSCTALQRVTFSVTGSELQLRFEAHAVAAGVVTLPAAPVGFTITQLFVDGASAGVLRTDNAALAVAVAVGRHDIIMRGTLDARGAFAFSFPMLPSLANLSASTAFTLEGVSGGHPDRTVQLVRNTKQTERADVSTRFDDSSTLPPLVVVERTIGLGLQFDALTDVRRLSALGVPVTVTVPLLNGESVTSENVRAEGGSIKVIMGPADSSVTFRSRLAIDTSKPIELVAMDQPNVVEVWRVEQSPLWHMNAVGIAPIAVDDPVMTIREFRPFPKETLSLQLRRPLPVTGQSMTIDSAAQVLNVGQAQTEMTVTLQLRASQALQHPIELPQNARLQRVSIDGQMQPLRDDHHVLTLPIAPGAHEVQIATIVDAPITFALRTAAFDAHAPSVNTTLSVQMPTNRWILFAVGDGYGPGILFWSLIAVLIVLGFVLGAVHPRLSTQGPVLSKTAWVLLMLGLSQVGVLGVVVVVWLLALRVRGALSEATPVRRFQLAQIALVLLTAAALVVLSDGVRAGLLGQPEMAVTGNGSYGSTLKFMADRMTSLLPRATILSAPLWVWRLLMLAWALWLAVSLLRWLRAGFAVFGASGMWRSKPSTK